MAEAPHNGPRPQAHDQAETYTPKEAGRILGITDERIRQMLEAGELEGEKRGGRWHVYQWSVHDALKERGSPRTKKAPQTNEAASQEVADLRLRLENLQRELGRLEGRLELTEQTESTIREERDRLLQERDRERARADRLEEELRQSRRSWWSRLFGAGS
jgi:excisionase family DNA binding protein